MKTDCFQSIPQRLVIYALVNVGWEQKYLLKLVICAFDDIMPSAWVGPLWSKDVIFSSKG